ncbi:MAG: ABC transporter permease [Aquamicrobium sp.]|uniref:ABC transporter permease n=1 Tax=Aquamicrobium sp. TaxID=1872579 RepID=UPI00349EE117|nr:ABC transporter permease [Aquamicrobium sp.]MCO5158596.1 ABC transporter permease [Aquamicrobium sp.]
MTDQMTIERKGRPGLADRLRARGQRDGGLRDLIVPFILPALFVAIWHVLSTNPATRSDLLPTPLTVAVTLYNEIVHGGLVWHVTASLTRAFAGFALACAIGISLGLLMSQSRIVREVLSGPVEVLRPISSIAWIPLAILWFGIGFSSVIFVIMISCVFVILLNTLSAGMSVRRDLVDAALTLGATKAQIFRKVTIPAALPGIFLGMRVALTGAWGGVLIAEMIATQEGLGYLAVRAQASFRPDLVIACMIVVGVVGYALNMLSVALQRRLFHV